MGLERHALKVLGKKGFTKHMRGCHSLKQFLKKHQVKCMPEPDALKRPWDLLQVIIAEEGEPSEPGGDGASAPGLPVPQLAEALLRRVGQKRYSKVLKGRGGIQSLVLSSPCLELFNGSIVRVRGGGAKVGGGGGRTVGGAAAAASSSSSSSSSSAAAVDRDAARRARAEAAERRAAEDGAAMAAAAMREMKGE